jgi:hypothetical protein
MVEVAKTIAESLSPAIEKHGMRLAVFVFDPVDGETVQISRDRQETAQIVRRWLDLIATPRGDLQ